MKNYKNFVQLVGNDLTFISTFNGIGAFSNAIKQMGINLEAKFICEIDTNANKTYYNNNPFNPKKHIDDINDLLITVKKGLKVDVLVQTPPCQSFSLMGKRKGLNSSNGNLFLTAIQLQKKINASIVVYENVKGLLSHDKKVKEYKSLINHSYKNTIGHTLHTIENLLLEDERYNYYWEVLNSNEQGLPQNRERIFIAGIKKELDPNNAFNFPAKIDIEFTVKDILETNVDEKYFYKNTAKHKLNPTHQTRRDNKIHTYGKYESMTYESTRTVYLPYVAPCMTIGNNSKFLIDGRVRLLTPTENKRIHKFSEDFTFVGTQTNINKQLGNTVSSGVYMRLFDEIFKTVSNPQIAMNTTTYQPTLKSVA